MKMNTQLNTQKEMLDRSINDNEARYHKLK